MQNSERFPSPKLYEQVAGRIAQQIRSGVLRVGDRIPSVRRTSLQQRVSVSTVLQAYFLLENQGLIEARPQSGFYVRPRLAETPQEPKTDRPLAAATRLSSGDLIAEVLDSARRADVVPLGAATISPQLLPTKALGRLISQLTKDSGDQVLGYEFPPGNIGLRRQIARRALELGWALRPEDILITNGGTEALNLALRAVAKPGDSIAIESPSYYGVLELMESLGLKALEIPTHPTQGISLSALHSALKNRKARACVVIPSFHNPLGACMPDDKRKDLAALAAKFRVPVIEDDIFGDLYFTERRPKPVASFDREGWVLLCSSFAKTLAPGFRVGWSVAGRFQKELQKLKRSTTMATASLPQMVLAEYLKNGGYDRHLRQMRRSLAFQVQKTADAVARYFPKGTRISRPEGGYLLWVEFAKGANALELQRKALAEKISIAPGPIFSASGKFRNYIRLNCGHPWTDRIETALRRLGEWVQ